MACPSTEKSFEILRRKLGPLRRGHREGPPEAEVGVAVDGDQLPEERRRRVSQGSSILGQTCQGRKVDHDPSRRLRHQARYKNRLD